jgi:ADP-heptose:LPS heptosyltransferase
LIIMKLWRLPSGASLRYRLLDVCARRLSPASAGGDLIVVYSPGHLGDILHIVPMLKALRAGKPEAKIVWLVGPWSEPLAARYQGLVDEIRIFGPNLPQYTRGKRKWRQSAWTQWRIARALRREGVNLFLGAADAVSRFLVNAVGPKHWLGVGEWRPPRVRSEVQTQFQPYEKDRYEADAWTGVLQGIGIQASADRLAYTVTPDERQAADDFLKAEGVDAARPLALIAPGSGWSGKNWLPERFAEVVNWLLNEKGFQIAWVGSAAEQSLIPTATAADFNWLGKTSLPLIGALMEQAKLFVGNDGGLLHFAAAMDVPTVSIWGPTRPGKWGPQGPLHRQVRKVEQCEGCIYWDYREVCRHDHACMKAVGVEEIQGAVLEIL